MPELPEVETVKRTLEPLVKGREITAVDIHYAGIIKTPPPEKFRLLLPGL